MNVRLRSAIEEARTALSAEEQEKLADLIEVYIANHGPAPDFTEAERAELKRRHEAPFDPAPEAEGREFFARHRG
jgi:hypothetical protein